MSSTKVLEWDELDFLQRLAIKHKSEKSLLNFSRIWFELLQGDKFRVNWHHRLIARKLDEVIRGKTNKNIAIAIPPGGTKTELISIHMPAYINALTSSGKITRFRNLNLSFADTLVKRNSRRTRDIIKSPEYQELWPSIFGVNQAEEWEIINSKGKSKGQTVSRAMGGQITGGRGGYLGPGFTGAITMDDPDKPEDMFSKTKREAQHRRKTNTVRSRRGDKTKYHFTPFFIIQQRLHEDDTIGFCMNGGMGVDFELVEIPALITQEYIDTLDAETQRDCVDCIGNSEPVMVGGIPHWSYWPESEDAGQLLELWEKDEYTFMSQYQQKPKSITGSLIDTAWFGKYEQLPFIESCMIFVDTNSGKITDRNDYTVFLLAGLGSDGNLYVMNVSRGKWSPSELQEEAIRFWGEAIDVMSTQVASPAVMNIEDKQAGQGLIQDLKNDNDIPVEAIQRGTQQNKYARHCNSQPRIKNGSVFIPSLHTDDGEKITKTRFYSGHDAFSTEWVLPFIAECDALTVGVLMDEESGYDDQYDTLMDAIDKLLISDSGPGIVTGSRRRRR